MKDLSMDVASSDIVKATREMGIGVVRKDDGSLAMIVDAAHLPPRMLKLVEYIADLAEAPPAPKAPSPPEDVELTNCLSLLARQRASIGNARHPDERESGGCAYPNLRNLEDLVRRIGIHINHAVARHGYTQRLKNLESMILTIRARGVENYETEDPARATRLLKIGPAIIEKLDGYKPDPESDMDRPFGHHQTRDPEKRVASW